MLEGKVINDFNDIEDKLKNYKKGSTFKAEDQRYNYLKEKGFLGEGKAIKITIKEDK